MGKNICNPLGLGLGVEGLKPVVIMLVVQAVLAGVNVFYQLAIIDGMSPRVLISYRFIFTTAFVVPLALILERESKTKLTWKIAFQGFLSGLFGGALGHNLFIESLGLTSLTFATAMSNLIPAVTFILTLSLRLERLAIRTLAGKAKLVGSFSSLGGAMILTLYKGREVSHWSTNINLAKHAHDHVTNTHLLLGNQVLGSILAISSCSSFAIWYIVQGKLSEDYPYKYSCTALMCITASIQATIYSIIMERNWAAWKLGWNIRLLSSIYTGAICTGLLTVIITWLVRSRGALFVSIFMPCTLIYVAIVGYLFLNERLHLGSILGSVIIIVGLYIVLWGKAEEAKHLMQLALLENTRESEDVENRQRHSHPNIAVNDHQGDGVNVIKH